MPQRAASRAPITDEFQQFRNEILGHLSSFQADLAKVTQPAVEPAPPAAGADKASPAELRHEVDSLRAYIREQELERRIKELEGRQQPAPPPATLSVVRPDTHKLELMVDNLERITTLLQTTVGAVNALAKSMAAAEMRMVRLEENLDVLVTAVTVRYDVQAINAA